MPIKSLTATHLVQVCAACGAEHTISFDRGAQKTKPGPFNLAVGDTLELKVDAAAPVSVTFTAGDFPDVSAVTAAELATKLAVAISGISARDDSGGCLIESASSGSASRIEVTGGTARAALGFPADGSVDPCLTRPVIGVAAGVQKDPNVIVLRRCGCGANECLIRTFDAAPMELEGTHFSDHRNAVNALAKHFSVQGWSNPDLAAIYAAETRAPVDIHVGFPTVPIELSPPLKSGPLGGANTKR